MLLPIKNLIVDCLIKYLFRFLLDATSFNESTKKFGPQKILIFLQETHLQSKNPRHIPIEGFLEIWLGMLAIGYKHSFF